MSTNPNDNSTVKPPTALVNITSNKEELIRQKVEQERARLAREMGIDAQVREHFKKPVENLFTASQRAHTTLLFGGLTWKHEKLIHGALEGLGYKCEAVPTPNVDGLPARQGVRQQRPVQPDLLHRRQPGAVPAAPRRAGPVASRRSSTSYVFFTAGACGPCRFGMYEAEYRLALRNSGFDGFRVHAVPAVRRPEPVRGRSRPRDEPRLLPGASSTRMNMGDLINEVGYQIRPFEVEAGETDARASTSAWTTCTRSSRAKQRHARRQARRASSSTCPRFGGTAEYIGKFVDQLNGDDYTDALASVARPSRPRSKSTALRVKPIVKITGEFWAQTTEGDGNFNMFRFLEREGAQVMVEPIGTWIMYMIHQAKQSQARPQGRRRTARPCLPRGGSTSAPRSSCSYRKKLGQAEARRSRSSSASTTACVDALGGIAASTWPTSTSCSASATPSTTRAPAAAKATSKSRRTSTTRNKDLAHMVLSLKPFGCMPSTQSDGAQSAVVNHYKDMIYLPVETSGEGEINAHSRVQMALGEAKVKAKTRDSPQCSKRPGSRSKRSAQYVGRASGAASGRSTRCRTTKGVVGTAANFVLHVAELMKEGRERASSYAAD